VVDGKWPGGNGKQAFLVCHILLGRNKSTFVFIKDNGRIGAAFQEFKGVFLRAFPLFVSIN
jgi:hypothetical protein